MMSIFIPKTFGFSAERIKSLVERDLGKVRQVDIVKETCFIHVDEWYDGGLNEHAYPTFLAIDRMERGEAHKITSFDHATNSYTTLFLLKNHSKKQRRDVVVLKEKDMLEQIEEGCCRTEVLVGEGFGGENVPPLPPMRLIHPDSLPQQKQQPRLRPPSPTGPPPMRSQYSSESSSVPRKNRTEGRSSADDQYIHKLEKEIASLRAQNHAQVKDINDLRVQIYTQQIAADTTASAIASASALALQGSERKTRSGNTYNTAAAEEREEQVAQAKLDANNEFSTKAVPKPRKRAAPVEKSSSSNFRLATF
jgi:hypothetical protein